MQKKTSFLSLLSIFLLCFCVLPTTASAASPTGSDAVLTYHGAEDTVVAAQIVENRLCLFLPSSADLHALTLDFAGDTCRVSANGKTLTANKGKAFDFLSLFPTAPADGRYTADFLISGKLCRICVMQSENLHSLHITSADPAKDLSYVHADKSNKAKNNPMVLLNADGRSIYQGEMKEIKGRGNSTWSYAKKPYQIKLKDKADLLELGADEAAKTWILLANYADDAMIRNTLTNDLAAALDIRYANHSTYVDLYYDGAYCGTYQLSEKTEIGESRINIRDLEKEIEDVNGEDVDFDDLPVISATNAHGNPMQVVDGVALPEDYTGGYLLEIDYEARAKEEKSWFRTTHGQYVVCKSPEYLPAEAVSYVSELYQAFEDAVYNGGIHPVTGKSYTEYMDLPSLAKMYLLLSLSQNGDAFLSSTYFYIPENEQKIYGGPVWDFDTAYGLYTVNQVSGFVPARTALVQMLLKIPSFREAVNEQWNNCLQPIIRQTVLHTSADYTADGVSSIGTYGAALAASRNMDALRWGKTDAYATHLDALYTFLQESYDWVETELTNPDVLFDDGFVDVEPEAWYKDSVSYVTDKGYFSGYSDILFQPEQKMTRAMLVTVLHRMAGKPAVSGSCSYTDVSPDTWYSDAILWAEQNGITTGIGNGRFGTEDAVSRQELIVFLHRFSQHMGSDSSASSVSGTFADSHLVASWAKEAMGWALDQQILNGATTNGQPVLHPRHTATRAEAAAILHRYDLAMAE